jgi:hypothetical protein
MIKRTKITLVAGATALALAGIGGGVAFAAGGTTGPTPATLTAAVSTASSTPATPGAAARAKHRGGLRARTEHGELTVRTKTGTETVDVQRGQVTAVSATSITVRSKDGFTATYAVASTSKVRAAKKAAAIGDVHQGDRVGVAAVKSGSTDTILRIGDAGK